MRLQRQSVTETCVTRKKKKTRTYTRKGKHRRHWKAHILASTLYDYNEYTCKNRSFYGPLIVVREPPHEAEVYIQTRAHTHQWPTRGMWWHMNNNSPGYGFNPRSVAAYKRASAIPATEASKSADIKSSGRLRGPPPAALQASSKQLCRQPRT